MDMTTPISVAFKSGTTQIYYHADFDLLRTIAPPERSIIITDENLKQYYTEELKSWRTITLPPGEKTKTLETIEDVLWWLIDWEADRNTIIVGFGGGVISDLAGFAAAIYKRGLRCGFMPTSILGMTDAAIGGKNGVNLADYKNMAGIIRQPEFLLYHFEVLQTLPQAEWINGFAEIIKHACIKDPDLFHLLEQHQLEDFKQDENLLRQIVSRNVAIKTDIVQQDEAENNERKLLNFGHTFGHAAENSYQLPHGHAVAIGIIMACKISEKIFGFAATARVQRLLEQYQLPVSLCYDPDAIMSLITADKKRFRNGVDYILLKSVGQAVVQRISVDELHVFFREMQ